MRPTDEATLARPRLNPRASGASIRPPPAHAGKPTWEERHGQGSDAQQQGEEEAEGGVEQEEKGRPRPLAVRFGTGAAPAGPESLRQEESIRQTRWRARSNPLQNLAPHILEITELRSALR